MILRCKITVILLILLAASTTLLKAQVVENNWANYGGFGWDNTMIGKPIKPFSMVTCDGKPVVFEKLKGKVIVLDFWATWCGPCRKLTADLDSALKPYYTSDFVMVGVNYLEKTKAGDPVAYWKQHNYQFPMTMNNDGYGKAVNAGNPVVIVIDQKGIVRGKWEAWTQNRAAEVQTLVWSLLDKPIVSLQEIVDKNRAHEYEKALWLYEALMQKDSSEKEALQQEKLFSLLHLSQAAATDFAKEWRTRTHDSEHALETVCRYFTETKGLFPNAYAYAAKAFETLITKYPANASNLIVSDYMSRCYYRAGDKITAIKMAEKSIALAKSQNANPKTNEYLQQVLEKYKQGTY